MSSSTPPNPARTGPHPTSGVAHKPYSKVVGVRLAGTGLAVPEKKLTNADLEKIMQTSDEWIVQRTGIRERRIADRTKGESNAELSARALGQALATANLTAKDLDLIVIATMTAEMKCPGTAALVAAKLGAGYCGAFDINAACSGFVYSLNIVHALMQSGVYRTVGLVGVDCLSSLMDYSDNGRGTAIIFGDGAGAAVFTTDPDASKGVIAQAMHSDGSGWKEIYVPERVEDFPPGVSPDEHKLCHVQMNGASVFKFAVSTFPELIAQTLAEANLSPEDVDMYVCHQSNARILLAARERFGIPEERLYVNIDRYGNTVGASIPLCLHELRASGRVKDGMKVMFLGFGGGLTWASSLWQL